MSDLQIDAQQIPLYNQPTQVSFFGITWLRDRRDNSADAARGSFNTISVDLAGRPIGSVASFVRVFVQNSTYTPIGRRLLFARSTRLGVMTPIGTSIATDIPLPERFFAGGGTSIRGFGLNQAGPRDPLTGFPIGGLASLTFNQELRFPMNLPWVGNRLGGGVFYDAGNVFNRFQDITLRTAPLAPVFDPAQPTTCISRCTNDLAYFSHTVGFALRYNTPVGPVSVDLGYQLNRREFSCSNGNGRRARPAHSGRSATAAGVPVFRESGDHILMRRALSILALWSVAAGIGMGGSAPGWRRRPPRLRRSSRKRLTASSRASRATSSFSVKSASWLPTSNSSTATLNPKNN